MAPYIYIILRATLDNEISNGRQKYISMWNFFTWRILNIFVVRYKIRIFLNFIDYLKNVKKIHNFGAFTYNLLLTIPNSINANPNEFIS